MLLNSIKLSISKNFQLQNVSIHCFIIKKIIRKKMSKTKNLKSENRDARCFVFVQKITLKSI